MFWATVSSVPVLVFCWLYQASPSLAAKNIINMISVLTIWWFQCVESPLGLLEKCVCNDWHVLLTKLLASALLHFVLQGQTCLLCHVSISWLSTFIFQSPLMKKDNGLVFFVCVSVLEGLVGLQRTIQLQLLQCQWLGHRHGLLWCWMIGLRNKLRSFCHFWRCTQVLYFKFFFFFLQLRQQKRWFIVHVTFSHNWEEN